MGNLNSPCKDCNSRKYLCHSTCISYYKFTQERKQYLEARAKENKKTQEFFGVVGRHK